MTKILAFQADELLVQQVDDAANAEHRTRSNLLRVAVLEYLDKHRDDPDQVSSLNPLEEK